MILYHQEKNVSYVATQKIYYQNEIDWRPVVSSDGTILSFVGETENGSHIILERDIEKVSAFLRYEIYKLFVRGEHIATEYRKKSPLELGKSLSRLWKRLLRETKLKIKYLS